MRRYLIASIVLLLSVSLGAQQISWKRSAMDGHRTAAYKTDPSAKPYKGGSTAKVEALVQAAQPAMADVKQVVGYSNNGMYSRGADTPLANFATDALLAASEKAFGRKADFAILNSGGIRAAVPQGEVLKDDIMSIFPFKNFFVLVEYPGSVMLDLLKSMAQRHFQPVAGVEAVVENRELVSAKVGGKEIDPDGVYYLATIDFLLGSGDNMRLAQGATNIQRTQLLVFDVIMDYINSFTASGRSLDCEPDGRVKYIGMEVWR